MTPLPSPLARVLDDSRRALRKGDVCFHLAAGAAAGAAAGLALTLLFAATALICFVAGYPFPMKGWTVFLLGASLPPVGLLAAAIRAAAIRRSDYETAMRLDGAAGTKNRVATAVEFWGLASRHPFQEAAIQEGIDVAARLDPAHSLTAPLPSRLRRNAWLRPLLLLFVASAALFIPRVTDQTGSGSDLSEPGALAAALRPAGKGRDGAAFRENVNPVRAGQTDQAASAQRKEDGKKGKERARSGDSPEGSQKTTHQKNGGASRGARAGAGGERTDKIPGGEPKETKKSRTGSSGSPAGSRGTPAGGAGKPGEGKKQEHKKAGPEKKSKSASRSRDARKSDSQGGAMAAGTSRMGGSFSPVTHSWKSDETGGDEDSGGDESDDEADEEKRESRQRGGMQPSMRDRRPPPSRDLGLSQPGDDPGKGRGGPTPPKKSRGTASMILGLPVPDTVKGLPNPGASRVEQERTAPRTAPEKPGIGPAPVRGDRREPPRRVGKTTGREAGVIERYFKELRGQKKPPPGGNGK